MWISANLPQSTPSHLGFENIVGDPNLGITPLGLGSAKIRGKNRRNSLLYSDLKNNLRIYLTFNERSESGLSGILLNTGNHLFR